MAIKNLKGKYVLITGAASGIGRSAALAFAKRGAHIIACDLNAAALESLKREVEALGVSCAAHAVNVADEAAMKALADTVHKKLAAVDVLVNNAGIGYLGRFLDSDLSNWRRVIDVNLMGVVHGCYHFIPKMLAAGGARQVLIVSSIAGIYGAPTMGSYAASKAAVWNFAEVLKMELAGTQIGVTTVCPGTINTPITATNEKSRASTVSEDQAWRLEQYHKTAGGSPNAVAEDMVRAVLNGKDLLLTGPHAQIVNFARRLPLRLTRRLMLNTARKVGYL